MLLFCATNLDSYQLHFFVPLKYTTFLIYFCFNLIESGADWNFWWTFDGISGKLWSRLTQLAYNYSYEKTFLHFLLATNSANVHIYKSINGRQTYM